MPYVPDATAVDQPEFNTVKASTAAAEFRAIKLYLRDVLLAGLNALTTVVAGKADLASPSFTGTPTGPTAASGDNSAQLTTSAFVQAAIASVNAAAGVLTYSSSSLTTISLAAGQRVRCTNAALTNYTLPVAPPHGTICAVVVGNARADNTVTPGGATINGDAGVFVLDDPFAAVEFVYDSSTTNWSLL